MMRRLLVVFGAVLAFGLVAAPKASADTFQLNDIYCNCLPAGSTDGGTVTLTQVDATHVQFVVDLNDLLNFHYSNAFDLFAFSYSGTNPTLTLSSILPAGWSLSTTATGSGSMDGAGHSFEFFINCPSCSAAGGISGVNVLTFTVASATAISMANFETLNGNNNDFAASVSRLVASGCTGVIGGGNGTGQSTAQASTGSSSTDTCGVTVPDGGTTVGLLGLGMLGLAYLRRRLA